MRYPKKLGWFSIACTGHAAAVAGVVSDAHESCAGRSIDSSQLSEAERTVLRLLARGHTAKSIASVLSLTPAAVNERLRQARRKTGLGSSREVARLLVAQESRHKKIEVANGNGSRNTRVHPVPSGAAIMIIVLVAALGASTYFAEQLSEPTSPAEASIAGAAIGRAARIHDGDTLVGGRKWWRSQGLSIGTVVYNARGEEIGTVERMEPGNDIVRHMLVRSPDGQRVISIDSGSLSLSNRTWTTNSVEPRGSN